MSVWKRATEPPKKGGAYLCYLMAPDHRGGIVDYMQVVHWYVGRGWNTTAIVHSWQRLPKGPRQPELPSEDEVDPPTGGEAE